MRCDAVENRQEQSITLWSAAGTSLGPLCLLWSGRWAVGPV